MVQPLKNAVVGLMAFAAGCDFVEPSAQSNQLENAAIPRIAAWSSSGEATLNLSRVSDLGAYEEICLVPEYHCLDDVQSGDIEVGIRGFHSSFGKCVPENRVAFMVVSNHEAHAALLDRRGAFSNISAFGKCVQAPKAILRRTSDPLAAQN